MDSVIFIVLLVGFIFFLKGWKIFKPAPPKPRVYSPKKFKKTAASRINSGHDSKSKNHAPPPPIPPSRTLRGRAHVIDGDTIVINKIKVRLAGVDAPELDQPWGQKSKWKMIQICKGHIIDVKLDGTTSYDRLVGTCYLSDGTDIGAELIKAGLALDYTIFSLGKYRHLESPEFRRKLKRYGAHR